MKQPARAPKDQFPGALNRFDDFVAYHMTRAHLLHDTLHLFASHKYFIYAYEQALRTECGYTGYQPYMNCDRYANDPIHSPMFNGNASSMGDNGAPEPNYKGDPQQGKNPNLIPSAGGGGCVTEGPFKDMVVGLGPMGAMVDNVPPNPRGDSLGSNPRCLRRDVNRNSALGATANYTYSLIMDYPDINGFYNRYLGSPPLKNDSHPWGLHTAGHYIHGGDPGGDFYCSPGDPVFYFHHGMLDRVWWIWQMQDPENRIHAVPNFLDQAPPAHVHGRSDSPETAIIDLEWLAPPIKLLEANDQLGGNGGALCYVYV
ncbi:Di-copper centre-containing protein [Thozetella sp. PMI_491]|nr:Di-copper centre-containing protein [Thozetella sp. PMI_491]